MRRTQRNFSPGAAIGHAANLGVALSSGFAIVDRYQRIGERKSRKVKRSKRNPPFTADINIPDEIIDRFGNEHINDIFNTEYPAETLRALIAQAVTEDDYHAAGDYTQLLAIIEGAEGRAVNPFDPQTLAREIARRSATGDRLGYPGNAAAVVIARRHPEIFDILPHKKKGMYWVVVRKQRNPSFTVNVDLPAVRESVDVKALTVGGALRKGKRQLRSAAKVHPKWSVEKNSADSLVDIPTAITDTLGSGHVEWLLSQDDPRAMIAIGWNDAIDRGQTEQANAYSVLNNILLERDAVVQKLIESNPYGNRKRFRMATLLNPQYTRASHERKIKILAAALRGDTATFKRLQGRIKQLSQMAQRARAGTRQNGKISSAIKSKLNSAARMFHGANNPHYGKTRNVPISDFARGENYTRLGGVPWVRPVDTYGVIRPNGHKCPNGTDHACDRCSIRFNPRTSYLGMTAQRRLQLMGTGVQGEARKLRAQIDRANPDLKGQTVDLGPVYVQWYVTEEKHSNSMRPIHYYHEHGEDTRNPADRPHLMLSAEPMFFLSGGKYTVTERGIEN
jgi:hypothetical protein